MPIKTDPAPDENGMYKLSPYQRIIIFSVSFLFWLFVFKDLVFGSIPLNGDTNANYLILKYFFNSILNGTFPLWDPYTYLGRHFFYILSSCALNPFAWVIPLLHMVGFDFYQAYLCFIVGYYFVGCLGFWFLLSDILKDERSAFLGFVLLLFSGMGAMLFNQVLIVYIFVPSVWFCVFMVRFFRSLSSYDFLFGISALMVLCVSCFPFYFVTFFLIFNVLFVLIFPDIWLECFYGLRDFIRRRFPVVVFGLLALTIAFGPMIIFKMMDAKGDAVFPGRHKCQSADKRQCSDDAKLSYGEIAYYGSLGERLPGRRTFEHLDKFDFNSDDFFYIPVICYFMIALALFTRFDRLRLLVMGVSMGVFLVALGAASPVHGFLYDRIFYFEYFRNLYFLMAFLIPLFVFFAAAQFKALLDAQTRISVKTSGSIVVLAATLMILILSWQGHALDVTYVTVVLSAFLALLYGLGLFNQRGWQLMVLLMFVAVMEPWYVFVSFQSHIPAYNCLFPKSTARNGFSWKRPSNDTLDLCMPLYRNELYSNLRYPADMRDSYGLYDSFPDTLMRYAFQLSQHIPRTEISSYSSNKIIVYDQVLDMKEEDTGLLREALGSRSNLAFVSGLDSQLNTLRFPRAESPKEMIIADSQTLEIKVLKFDPNRLLLTTHFEGEKFLVYNDAYSSYWKAYVNGRLARVYRTNIAFKGVHLPAGDNTVDLRYEPPGGAWFYLILLGAMIAVPTTGFTLKSKHKNRTSYEI